MSEFVTLSLSLKEAQRLADLVATDMPDVANRLQDTIWFEEDIIAMTQDGHYVLPSLDGYWCSHPDCDQEPIWHAASFRAAQIAHTKKLKEGEKK